MDLNLLNNIIVDTIWKDNILYCYCGSWFKYANCCEQNNWAWYENEEIKNILKEKEKRLNLNKSGKNIDYGITKDIYKEFEKYWRLKNCIYLDCQWEPIKSHLFTKAFIKKGQKDGFKFKINWIDKELWADSFKINLWCLNHDTATFESTDKIKDIELILNLSTPNRDQLLWELFVKTLSFKVKTYILDQMWCMLWLILLTAQNKFETTHLETFSNNYYIYNTLLSQFDKIFENVQSQTVFIPYLSGKSWRVIWKFDSTKAFYQVNIKVIGTELVFVVDIINNWNWTYFIWSTESQLESDIKEYLDNTHKKLEDFKLHSDIKWALDWIENEFYDSNRIYFLNLDKWFHWNSYIYGIKSFSSETL